MGKRIAQYERVLTPEQRDTFLAVYADCGSQTRAAMFADTNLSQVHALRAVDEHFAAHMDSARLYFAEGLEIEAHRRAVTGTLRPVYFKGVKCGVIREYSDTLLALLLKAELPAKYGDRMRLDAGSGGTAEISETERVARVAAIMTAVIDRAKNTTAPEQIAHKDDSDD